MSHFVFIHGPGAGGCADSFIHQLNHFDGSVAPSLPGHPHGTPCKDVNSYTEWLRGWLWAQNKKEDLILVGFTLGACIALEYALDYPEEVQAIILMTVSMAPKKRPSDSLAFRIRASQNPSTHQEWLDAMRKSMMFIETDLREQLIKRHIEIGPLSQHNDLVTIDNFDVRDRIHNLESPLMLIRGIDDPGSPPEYELDIHNAVRGSEYIKLPNAGHFPMVEQPEKVNGLIETFLETNRSRN